VRSVPDVGTGSGDVDAAGGADPVRQVELAAAEIEGLAGGARVPAERVAPGADLRDVQLTVADQADIGVDQIRGIRVLEREKDR